MKVKALIFGIVAIIGISAMAMKSANTDNETINIPQVVQQAFSKKYPAAQKVEWEEEKGEYEAEFKMDKKEMSARFQEDGSWLETETELGKKDLPESVKLAISNQFADFELEKAELLETPETPLAYEVKLEDEKNGSALKAVFAADGTILKKEVKKEDNDDDNDSDDEDEENEEEHEENGPHK